jgi:hypothetical protein
MAISRLERAPVRVLPAVARQIAEILGARVEELFGDGR